MGFLNPFMLFGITAVSVPIIIHLLNRRKFQKVVWAAMRFLKVSVEQNQRRMKIEDMILLLLRCLLLILLALALARPAMKQAASEIFGQTQVTAVVVLDNSLSMGMSDGTQTRFEKAKKTAEQAMETMPAGSSVAILLASDIVNGVVPEPTFDFNLARKAIKEAPLTDRGSDLGPAVNKAIETLKGRFAIRKEIYILTDGQTTGWKQFGEIENTLKKVKGDIRTHFVFINEHEVHNLGIDELRLDSGMSPAKHPLRFAVRVTNHGREPARDVRVSLHVDSDPPSNEYNLELLGAGESKTIPLFAKLGGEGFHSVTARLPEDRLVADDKRSVAVRAIKEVRVLLVDGEPGAEPRDSEVFYLRHALTPVAGGEQAGYFIKPVVASLSDLSAARLDDYDAVVLANVAELSETTVVAFEQYLRRGGGLVVFPGGKVNPVFYNDSLVKKHQLLPALLGEIRGQADQDEKYLSFQDKNFDHPVVAIWNDEGSGTLSSARIFRAIDLLPAPYTRPPAPKPGDKPADVKLNDAGEPRVVLRYSDGRPAVMERTWGLGRVVLFSTTADTAWNDLPVRPAFVPVMHRVLGSIIQRQDEGLNVRVGERFLRRTSSELLGKDARVTKPRQTDAVPELRRVEMLAGAPALHFEQTDLSGLYEFTVADPLTTFKFAAQASALESTLDELSAEQKKLLSASAHVVDWTPGLSLKDVVLRERSGLEFWLPIVLAALAVAALETFLAQWFSRSK